MLTATIRFLMVVVVCSGCVLAQIAIAQENTQRNEPVPAVSTPVLSSSAESEAEEVPIEEHVVPVPEILGGLAPTLSFSSKTERSNLLQAGFGVGANYDDNALVSNGEQIGNWSYSIFPNISVQKTTSRTRLDAGYAAGLTVNQELSSQNQGSHDLNLSLLYRVSPHVNLLVTDQFGVTSGIFSQYGSDGRLSPGVLNTTLPAVNQLRNATSAQVGYQFSATDAVGIGGGYELTNFGDNPSSASLFDYRSGSVATFYAHKLTSRNWIGVSYRFQRMTFSEVGGQTLSHSVLLFHAFTLPARMSLNFFAGPEYTDQNVTIGGAAAANSTKWSVAGGASVNVTASHTSLYASLSRRTSAGGGYQLGATSTALDGGVRHRIGRTWTLSAGGGYAVNDSSASLTSVPGSVTSSFVTGGIERKFRESFSARAAYYHEFLQGQDILFPDATAQRNRVLFSVSYTMTRPLGR